MYVFVKMKCHVHSYILTIHIATFEDFSLIREVMQKIAEVLNQGSKLHFPPLALKWLLPSSKGWGNLHFRKKKVHFTPLVYNIHTLHDLSHNEQLCTLKRGSKVPPFSFGERSTTY